MKDKYPLPKAFAVAVQLESRLAPFCERIEIAGSIRRQKETVGDIEILFVPKTAKRMRDLFMEEEYSLVWAEVDKMIGIELDKRPNVNGQVAWGDQNRLAIHTASGIPVDFFATTQDKWWNSLVVRTGGKENNMAIAKAANSLGWHWEAYGTGFHHDTGTEPHYKTRSEEDVFRFVGLSYLLPHERK